MGVSQPPPPPARTVSLSELEAHRLADASALNIDVCLASGQTFSWARHGEFWGNVLEGRLALLSEKDGAVLYWCRPGDAAATGALLAKYFRLEHDLHALYADWAARDAFFAAECVGVPGIRLLDQPGFEALISFICSQNNGIARIASMVRTLKAVFGGAPITLDGSVHLHPFPQPADLAGEAVGGVLVQRGFGYRARYVQAAARMVAAGALDLGRLRGVPYEAGWAALLGVLGVGPKVADCVALTGLGQMCAVPIDTHIWRIARKHYAGMPAGRSLTAKTYTSIGDQFRRIFGPLAGWAHLVRRRTAAPLTCRSSLRRRSKTRKRQKVNSLFPAMQRASEAEAEAEAARCDVARVAVLSALLGVVAGGAAVLAVALPQHTRLCVYVLLLGLFHFLEFLLTAAYHPEAVTAQAFLLDHSAAYTLSVLASLLEYAAAEWLLRGGGRAVHARNAVGLFGAPRCCRSDALGVVAVGVGQGVRTRAMLDAARAFTHEIAEERRPEHRLVRSGVYSFLRHPSYAGFFVWSLGSQILLGNALCFLVFAVALHRFFAARIRCEEHHLLRFFPTEYPVYRRTCPSGIPFIE